MPHSFYLAVEPPAVDRARLSLVMRRLGDPSPLPHVTVVEPPRLSSDLSWWQAVKETVSATKEPVAIHPEGVRTFDDRVLYVALHAPHLAALRQRLLDAIAPASNDRASCGEVQPFVPHLTLVVARHGKPLPDPEAIEPLVAHFDPFPVLELAIYRRDLAAHAYRAWRRVPLGSS
jgi:2'-5' RNA ligase